MRADGATARSMKPLNSCVPVLTVIGLELLMMVTSKPFLPMSSALCDCDSVACRCMIPASVTRRSLQDQHAQHNNGNPDQSESSTDICRKSVVGSVLITSSATSTALTHLQLSLEGLIAVSLLLIVLHGEGVQPITAKLNSGLLQVLTIPELRQVYCSQQLHLIAIQS